jgi:hypothetical protein
LGSCCGPGTNCRAAIRFRRTLTFSTSRLTRCSAAVSFVRIHRSIPGGDRGSLIDTSIVAVGASALAWVLVGAPYVQAGRSLVDVGVALTYPLGDLLVLGTIPNHASPRADGSCSHVSDGYGRSEAFDPVPARKVNRGQRAEEAMMT